MVPNVDGCECLLLKVSNLRACYAWSMAENALVLRVHCMRHSTGQPAQYEIYRHVWWRASVSLQHTLLVCATSFGKCGAHACHARNHYERAARD
jgi:hypothetical protein